MHLATNLRQTNEVIRPSIVQIRLKRLSLPVPNEIAMSVCIRSGKRLWQLGWNISSLKTTFNRIESV